MSAEMPVPVLPQGLSWSWEMDFATVLTALSDGPAISSPSAPSPATSTPTTASSLTSDPGSQDPGTTSAGTGPCLPGGEADLENDEGYLAAVEQRGQMLPAGVAAVRVAERLAPGPDLVAWLSLTPAEGASDYDLAGGASSWRRAAAYTQAQELAYVAQIASRAAQRDPRIEVGTDGRPARVPAAAAAEVSLALTMSHDSAAAWTYLAVDLTWRLPATGAALAQGLIDLPRARLIAGETAMLSEEAARAVEARVLPTAGQHTNAKLRHALQRAVIAADPDGAERRKKDAERRAKVRLYPDPDHTATITAQGLPAVSAAAAMTRLTAMACAMKAAGYGGGIDFLRTQVLVGLILGTLPLIPPPADGPPDHEPGPDSGPPAPGGPPAPDAPPDNEPGPGGDGSTGDSDGPRGPSDGPSDGPWDGFPDPCDEDAPEDDGPVGSSGVLTGRYWPSASRRSGRYPLGTGPPGTGPPGTGPPRAGPPGDEWLGPRDDEDWLDTSPVPDWPGLPAAVPPAVTGPKTTTSGAGPGASMSRPVPGLLDVTAPWHTLTGCSPEPGHLGRIGPITAADARHLAACATRDSAAIWRVIITNRAGQALAVTRLPRLPRRSRSPRLGTSRTAEPPGSHDGDGIGLVGRITVIIAEDTVDSQAAGSGPEPDLPPFLRRALRHAAKALDRARAAAQADADAGGCAHLSETPAYRVPPRQRDYLNARDATCRYTTCRRPAWLCDIDHTKPHHQGGRTCRCNNGPICRIHHQIKQLPGWSLQQVSPGVFDWITPGSRVYTAIPDTYPL